MLLQFQGDILKPSYNSIDLVEVELTDDELRAARDYNSDLISVSFLTALKTFH